MALTNNEYKNFNLGHPGVTMKDLTKFKVKVLTNKQINDIFKETDFRIITNKNGVIKLKKGYGSKKPTLTFDSNKRVTLVEPYSYVKAVPTDEAAAIRKLQDRLAG